MNEPDAKEQGWEGEGEAFTTLHEEGQWVLRKAIPGTASIPYWISHFCEDRDNYSHRYDDNYDHRWDVGPGDSFEYSTNPVPSWEVGCEACGSELPKGLIALYKMFRMHRE